MYKIHLAQSVRVTEKVRSILSKFIPLSLTALFSFSSFAFAECPNGSTILEKYNEMAQTGTTKKIKWFGKTPVEVEEPVYSRVFVKDGANTSWELTAWPAGAMPDSLVGKTLELKSVKATLLNAAADPYDTAIKNLTCNYYVKDDDYSKEYSLTMATRAKLTATSYVLEQVNVSYSNNWRYSFDSATKTGYDTCPAYTKDAKLVRDLCKFTTDTKAETNGYWADARYRCGDAYVQCNRHEAEMNQLAAKLEKTGCEQLTCSKEINEMNGYVAAIARLQSYGVAEPWWTCWSTHSDKRNGGYSTHNLEWRITASAKQTPYEEANRLPSQWGTLQGTRVWKDHLDSKQRDVACFNDARQGKVIPSGFWPDYSSLGIEVNPG